MRVWPPDWLTEPTNQMPPDFNNSAKLRGCFRLPLVNSGTLRNATALKNYNLYGLPYGNAQQRFTVKSQKSQSENLLMGF
jgi:hypothetical protein